MMNPVLEKYLEYVENEQKGSINTLSAYRSDIGKFIDYINGKGIYEFHKLSFTDINSYILNLEKNNSSKATVSRNISSIRSFFYWMFSQRMIENNPAQNLKAPKIIRKSPEVLTRDEMLNLLEAPEHDSAKGLRDCAILELLYATGMRVTELIMLTLNDVNLSLKTVRIEDDVRERMIPFGEPAKRALMDYINQSRDKLLKNKTSDVLFVNINGGQMTRQGVWKIIKGYGDFVGIKKDLTPHIIRHTFAAHMVANGADLKTLSEILGHEDVTATQIYQNFSVSKLENVYEKTHPRK